MEAKDERLKPAISEARFHPSVLEFEDLAKDGEKYLEELRSILAKSYVWVRQDRLKRVLRVQAVALRAIREFLDSKGFVELLPPIIGPVTDPGIRGARQVSIDYYGKEYKVMSSAILYKQAAATALGKIYFVSPNIRLEPLETAYTGRHLTEFVQVDVEAARMEYTEAMDLAEGLIRYVVKVVREEASAELEALGRELPDCTRPFPRLTHSEAVSILRSIGLEVDEKSEIPWEGERILSAHTETPFFIYDYPLGSRGFYDREDPDRPGVLRDFDALYPEGFGEAVSGAEREYEYEKVVARMRASGEDPSKYGWYLEMLREGIEPTAGFGIGVERLTRFLCGLRAVWEARLCPKVAGIHSP